MTDQDAALVAPTAAEIEALIARLKANCQGRCSILAAGLPRCDRRQAAAALAAQAQRIAELDKAVTAYADSAEGWQRKCSEWQAKAEIAAEKAETALRQAREKQEAMRELLRKVIGERELTAFEAALDAAPAAPKLCAKHSAIADRTALCTCPVAAPAAEDDALVVDLRINYATGTLPQRAADRIAALTAERDQTIAARLYWERRATKAEAALAERDKDAERYRGYAWCPDNLPPSGATCPRCGGLRLPADNGPYRELIWLHADKRDCALTEIDSAP